MFARGMTRKVLCLSVALALLGALPARAALFDDDEARRQIKDLSLRSEERIDTLSKGQIDLLNQIQALREENAKLRGLLENLGFELESTKKRQQDFYGDLDARLRKIEAPQPSAQQMLEVMPEEGGKSASDPAAEAREYESALNLFKANKTKEAAQAFDSFTKTHAESSLTPSAYYWLGNAHYTLHDCKKSIDANRVVVSKWPQNAKSPDALLNIATCHQELGDAKGSKATFESVLSKYPESSAAVTAKQRLKK